MRRLSISLFLALICAGTGGQCLAAEATNQTAPVKVVKERDRLILKQSSQVIAAFETQDYLSLTPLRRTDYFILTLRKAPNLKSIVDRSGTIRSIGAESTFDKIESLKNGTIAVETITVKMEILESPPFEHAASLDLDKIYRTRLEAENAIVIENNAQSSMRHSEYRGAANSQTRVIPAYAYVYGTVGIRRYILNADLSIQKTLEGFSIAKKN